MQTYNYPMAQIPDRIESAVKNFTVGHSDDTVVALVTTRFFETLARQIVRYNQLESVILELNQSPNLPRPLHEIQFDFMDYTENFHAHTYMTISALCLLLQRILQKNITAQMPTKEMRSFLTWLTDNTNSSVLKSHLAELEKSREFRAKIVIHPQNHVLHDWMTYNNFTHDPVMIYFDRKGDEVFARASVTDPYSPDFDPPVNYKTFYIPPDFRKIQKAIFHGFPFILERYTPVQ